MMLSPSTWLGQDIKSAPADLLPAQIHYARALVFREHSCKNALSRTIRLHRCTNLLRYCTQVVRDRLWMPSRDCRWLK